MIFIVFNIYKRSVHFNICIILTDLYIMELEKIFAIYFQICVWCGVDLTIINSAVGTLFFTIMYFDFFRFFFLQNFKNTGGDTLTLKLLM